MTVERTSNVDLYLSSGLSKKEGGSIAHVVASVKETNGSGRNQWETNSE